jgi:hypothetical protein
MIIRQTEMRSFVANKTNSVILVAIFGDSRETGKPDTYHSKKEDFASRDLCIGWQHAYIGKWTKDSLFCPSSKMLFGMRQQLVIVFVIPWIVCTQFAALPHFHTGNVRNVPHDTRPHFHLQSQPQSRSQQQSQTPASEHDSSAYYLPDCTTVEIEAHATEWKSQSQLFVALVYGIADSHRELCASRFWYATPDTLSPCPLHVLHCVFVI